MPISLVQKGKTTRSKGKLKRDRTKGIKTKRDKTMGINVSTSTGFENQSMLRDTAKNILRQKGVEQNKAQDIAEKINIFEYGSGNAVLNASAQITLNNSLKETLKYLQAHANDKRKKYVLGELWQMFTDSQNSDGDNSYNGELIDFEVDSNVKNIFAA